MTNPNPGLITDPMWNLWLGASQVIPGVQLSGIYANKPAYHNTVNNNLRNWPDNYSVKLPLDLVNYNRDKARAIDLTQSDSEMVKWTTRMKNAFENPKDPRLDAVKEFYGTLDNKNVFGLSKNAIDGPVRRVSSDSSHLWHGHTSIFTAFVNNWNSLKSLISVWRGETLEEWSKGTMFLPSKGDTGEEVKYWQNIHNTVRDRVTPTAPVIETDGEYGPATMAAFADFWKKSGGVGTFDGGLVTGWLATQYHKALAAKYGPSNSSISITPDQIQTAVDNWFSQHHINVTGTLNGTLEV